MPTVRDLLQHASELTNLSDTPLLDCQILLADCLTTNRAWLYAHDTEEVAVPIAHRYRELVARRKAGEPIAYIRGRQSFWDMDLEVTTATLIPRPDTECLVERVLAVSAVNATVLDVGTGSGAIAIAIARERADWQVFGIDVSAAAIKVAERNADKYAPNRISFLQTSFLAPIAPHSTDIVVSNPPYVEADDPALRALRNEPKLALVSGQDGLDAIRQLAETAWSCLKPGGTLLLEHGASQQARILDLMTRRGYVKVEGFRDHAGLDRIASGSKPKS